MIIVSNTRVNDLSSCNLLQKRKYSNLDRTKLTPQTVGIDSVNSLRKPSVFVTVNNYYKRSLPLALVLWLAVVSQPTLYKHVFIACRIRNSITVRTYDEINGPASPSPQWPLTSRTNVRYDSHIACRYEPLTHYWTRILYPYRPLSTWTQKMCVRIPLKRVCVLW